MQASCTDVVMSFEYLWYGAGGAQGFALPFFHSSLPFIAPVPRGTVAVLYCCVMLFHRLPFFSRASLDFAQPSNKLQWLSIVALAQVTLRPRRRQAWRTRENVRCPMRFAGYWNTFWKHFRCLLVERRTLSILDHFVDSICENNSFYLCPQTVGVTVDVGRKRSPCSLGYYPLKPR